MLECESVGESSAGRKGLLPAAVAHAAKKNTTSERRKTTLLDTLVFREFLAPEQIRETKLRASCTDTLDWVGMGRA